MRLGGPEVQDLPSHSREWQGWNRPPASQTFQGAAGVSSVTREHLCADRRDCVGPLGRLALGRVAWQASYSRNEAVYQQ